MGRLPRPSDPGRAVVHLDPGRRLPVAVRAVAVLTLAGSAIWCFALAGVGYGLGTQYQNFDDGFRYAEYVIVAAVVGLIVLAVFRRTSTKLARRAGDSSR